MLTELVLAGLLAAGNSGASTVSSDVRASWRSRKLCSAVQDENRAEVLRLISRPDTAPLASLDDEGRSVLEVCFPREFPPSAEGDAEFLRFLVGMGVDLNRRRPGDGATVLLSRLQSGQGITGESCIALLWAGADPRIPDLKGDLPLHAALATEYDAPKGQTGHVFRPDVVDALLSRGADLTTRDGGGWLPLHRVAFAGRRPEAVRWLLEHGADPNARASFSGMTPLDLVDVRRIRYGTGIGYPEIDAIESALVAAGGKRLVTHPLVLRLRREAESSRTPRPAR